VAEPAVLDPRDPASRPALDLWLSLQAAFALRPRVAVALLERCADPERALGEAGLAPLPALQLARTRSRLARLGARVVPLVSPAYPERLRRLSDAAPVLVVRGDPVLLSAPAVAVVGSRAPTTYGRAVAASLAAGIASRGLVVVSGLARGIDRVAHEAALEAGGPSVAFQACGADRVYPPEHRELAARLAATGAVVSELPLGTPPLAPYFPLRNRLISGVARAVLVIEARERSGSLVTARHAANQGVDVLAVPGPITAPASRGTNGLLHEGAQVCLGVEDVLAAIGMPEPAPRPDPAPVREAVPASPLLEALADAALTRDELARRLGLSAAALSAALVPLEIEGRIVEDRDGRLRPA
jgi:DNA processing protein